MRRRSEALDGCFRALADPTRRRVIERLTRGPATVSELARDFDMALPSFSQHLGVLERSGVVRSAKRGRVRTVRLAPRGLRLAEGWMRKVRERRRERSSLEAR